MADDMQQRIAGSIGRVDGIVLSVDVARLVAHWLGQFAEVARQRVGCPPVGLVEVQDAISAEFARSRQREQECPVAPEFVDLPRELGTTEAAAVLGISPDGVRWHARKGNLEGRKVGRQLMVTAASVDSLKRRNAERSA